MSGKWTADEIPRQDGRVAIVTGGNSGLGRVTALELARHGAQVVVACRSIEKGEAVAAEIAAAGGPKPRVGQLDLGSLESIRRFAEEFSDQRVDLLVNSGPKRFRTLTTPRSARGCGRPRRSSPASSTSWRAQPHDRVRAHGGQLRAAQKRPHTAPGAGTGAGLLELDS
ncbi:MAG: SDR family NAD(P)-dependent oxidoreductase, partial [Solirubrobacteraceae bacterium]